MGRVETRMYKRKRKRVKRLRILVLLVLLMVSGVLLWKKLPAGFRTENIGRPTPTPVTAVYDQNVESREVALPVETWYAIQTGVFSTEEAALQKADAYAERGAPGTVVQQGEKWRVFIACYGSETDAAAVKERLEQKQRVDTYLYAWACPELRLRLTGMAGQLDVAEAGFTLLMSTATALRDMATALDAAQLTTQEAVESIDALDSQITLWEDVVRSRFGKTIPALVQGMMTITFNWDARCDVLNAAVSATKLSAALKAQAMSMFNEICTWRSEIAAQ